MSRDRNLNIFFYLSAFISFIICLSAKENIIKLTSFLPLSFIFTYYLLSIIKKKATDYIITFYAIIFLYWVRLVFIPPIAVIQNSYLKVALFNIGIFEQSILLMVYENIFIAFFLFILFVKHENRSFFLNQTKNIELKLKGNRVIYIIFVAFSLAIFLSIGRDLDLFNFVIKPVGIEERGGDETDTYSLIIRSIVSSGMTFLYLILVETMRRRYAKAANKKYIIFSILFSLLMVCVIVGERRTNQVYIAFTTIYLLVRLYPSSSKKIIRSISFVALIVLLLMTIYKQFYAFLYSSYTEALLNADSESLISALTLDSYFFGCGTIAQNIQFANLHLLSIENLFYDLFRNIFGLNFILKDVGLTTDQLYNYTTYQGMQTSGYLMSSIAYGFIYLGALFSPIATALNITAALFCERALKKAKSIEMTYILAYIYIRFAFGMFENYAPLLNTASRYLIINGGIFAFANFFHYNKKKIL